MADAQNIAKMAAGKAVNPMAKVGMAKDFLKHWHILAAAAVFDIIGLIPIINIVTNTVFFCILWMYFGSKSKESQFLKIGVNGAINTIFDAATLIWVPCLAGTVIRILME